jgi:hypothetical protein
MKTLLMHQGCKYTFKHTSQLSARRLAGRLPLEIQTAVATLNCMQACIDIGQLSMHGCCTTCCRRAVSQHIATVLEAAIVTAHDDTMMKDTAQQTAVCRHHNRKPLLNCCHSSRPLPLQKAYICIKHACLPSAPCMVKNETRDRKHRKKVVRPQGPLATTNEDDVSCPAVAWELPYARIPALAQILDKNNLQLPNCSRISHQMHMFCS